MPNFPQSNTITEHDLWDADECGRIAATVRALRKYWIDRNSNFYTLGAGTYVDDIYAYEGIAAHTNEILERYFYVTPEFQKLHDTMQAALGCTIMVVPKFALPGFHIFDQRCNGKPGSFHVDTPYDRLISPPEFISPLTFTIPVEIPVCGAGLNWWPSDIVPLEQDYAYDEPQSNPLLPAGNYQEYKLGAMYLHDGLFYHQIHNPGDMAANEARITLQGHGLFLKSGGCLVYF